MFLGISTDKWLAFAAPILLAIIAGIFGAKFIRNKKIHKIGNVRGNNNQIINGDVSPFNKKEKEDDSV